MKALYTGEVEVDVPLKNEPPRADIMRGDSTTLIVF